MAPPASITAETAQPETKPALLHKLQARVEQKRKQQHIVIRDRNAAEGHSAEDVGGGSTILETEEQLASPGDSLADESSSWAIPQVNEASQITAENSTELISQAAQSQYQSSEVQDMMYLLELNQLQNQSG